MHINGLYVHLYKKLSSSIKIICVASLVCLLFYSDIAFNQNRASDTNLDNIFERASWSSMNDNIDELEKHLSEYPRLADYTSKEGKSLVFYNADNPEALRLLVKKGMKLNVKDNAGNTPLYSLSSSDPMGLNSQESLENALRMFLDAGIDINSRNNDGYTALYSAAQKNDRTCVELLLENGAILDVLTAAELCDMEKIKSVLSDDPAAVNNQDNSGFSALHIIAQKKPSQIDILTMLISSGADINLRDKDGWAPLHYAVDTQGKEAAEKLLGGGADVNIQTNEGDTPLHMAAHKGFWRIALLLIESGADVNARNESGFTPVAIADMNNRPMITDMLIEHGAEPFELNKLPNETWNAYIANPYSDNLLTVHLFALGENPAIHFETWYISGVYRAEHTCMGHLYITEIYDGTKEVGFKLGCLILFDSEGNIIKTIPEERIASGFLPIFSGLMPGEDPAYRKLLQREENGEIIDLPDLNHDTFSDIPTKRWGHPDRQYSVYATNNESIPRVFCIKQAEPQLNIDDVESGQVYFVRTSEPEPGISVIYQRMVRTGSRGSMISFTIDHDSPPEILETFTWNSDEGTFVETLHSEAGWWEIIE